MNGNAPTESADLELEHDLHNASTLLASEKRNGVRKKVKFINFGGSFIWVNMGSFYFMFGF